MMKGNSVCANESASTKSLVSMKTIDRTDHKTSWNEATFPKTKGREMTVHLIQYWSPARLNVCTI